MSRSLSFSPMASVRSYAAWRGLYPPSRSPAQCFKWIILDENPGTFLKCAMETSVVAMTGTDALRRKLSSHTARLVGRRKSDTLDGKGRRNWTSRSEELRARTEG